MNILKRNLAPIPSEAWEFVDEEARHVLKLKLNGRKVVDFVGPKGLEFASYNTGRSIKLDGGEDTGITYLKREVLPLVEIKVPFRMKMTEFDALARGADDVDTEPLINAAQKVAEAENNMVFYGLENANIKGIVNSSNQSFSISEDPSEILPVLIKGIDSLVNAGVGGPYTLLLNTDFYADLYRVDDRGYPLIRKVKEVVGDNIQVVPGLKTRGLLLSNRGGDFQLIVGQDIAIGYNNNTDEEIEFFFIESLTFKVNTPEAAVVIN